MTDVATKLPAKSDEKISQGQASPSHESFRRELDRLIEDFGLLDFWRAPMRRSSLEVEPFWRREWAISAIPAVDIAETENAFELTAEMPGLDEKSIQVKVANGTLMIKAEKQEEKEEKKKEYYLKERRFGLFERTFRVPEGVAPDKIEASFKKGVLTVTLPKTVDGPKPAKTIEVKAA